MKRLYEWGTFMPGGSLNPNPIDVSDMASPPASFSLTISGTWGNAVISVYGSDDGASWVPVLDAGGSPLVLSSDGTVWTEDTYNYFLAGVNEEATGFSLNGSVEVEMSNG